MMDGSVNYEVEKLPDLASPKARARLFELDLLKVVAIVCMIICHAVYMLGAHLENYEQDVAYFVGDYIFGSYLAVAHAFMFAMGVGIVFSRKNKPLDLVKRGIFIYLLAFVLNFFRYGIYALLDGMIEGQFPEETSYAFLVQDIFHFAGLALIFTGALKALKCREWQICLVGVAFSAIGGAVAFLFDGHPAWDYILGHFFVTTEDGSTFAFLNWYVFVGFGLLFGKLLRDGENKDKLYRTVLCVALPILVAYVTLSCVFGAMFLTKRGWYYAASLPEAIGLLSIDMTMLAAFYFLFKKVPEQKLALFTEMSRNVTPIYFAQWCVIGFADSVFCYLLEWKIPYWAQYLFGVVLIFLCFFIARAWRMLQKHHRSRHQKKA